MNANENDAAVKNRIANNKAATTKSFEYTTKIIWRPPADSSRLFTKFVDSIKIFE